MNVYDLSPAERSALNADLGPFMIWHETEYAVLHGGARVEELGIFTSKEEVFRFARGCHGVVVERTKDSDWVISEE